ncbi:NnrS family protein [uncultured Castellaniella sp.]|uniref:NnrS family protein n=1 Tax=uncultured Castellaniella sp. TaxID=647907 RepID=UPI00261C3D33|nr:NnrS family protein [uncultured Castellaniella sp.]
MSRLLNVEETPARAVPASPSMAAFLALGFRPLYIAGAGWAVISIALWIFAPQLLGEPLTLVAWHAHEMLWGFIITIAVGFLLTASATWTGFNPLQGRPLAALCILWCVARIGFLAGGLTAFWIATAAELLFFLGTSAALARVMFKGRSRRNYGIPALILALGVADLLYLLAALQGNYLVLMERFDLGLIGMAVVALLIARRVIPFFAMRMVPGLQIPMLVRSGHAQMVFSVLALAAGVLAQITGAPMAPGSGPHALPLIMAASLGVTGLISLVQLACWKPQAVLRKPMLWILYLGYAFIGIGLLAAAWKFSNLFDPAILNGVLARSATHVHLIGLAGFCILIIGMLTRTALGHLGRPLALDRSMLAGHWLMVLAALLRLAALWPSAASLHLLHLAALAWILSLGLYLWRFVPMLIRPRPDKPVPAAAPKPATIQPARAR